MVKDCAVQPRFDDALMLMGASLIHRPLVLLLRQIVNCRLVMLTLMLMLMLMCGMHLFHDCLSCLTIVHSPHAANFAHIPFCGFFAMILSVPGNYLINTVENKDAPDPVIDGPRKLEQCDGEVV